MERSSGERSTVSRVAHVLAAVLLTVMVGLPAQGADEAEDGPFQQFELFPMTYVGSRGEQNDVVLQADYARYEPAQHQILLEGVNATMIDEDGKVGFELQSERGTIDLADSSFLAEGSVRGRTADGRRLETERMAYHQERGVVYSDTSVRIRERNMSYRGRRGFEYRVRDGRFRLIGGASIEQTH